MIEKLAKSLVAWQIKNGYLKPADQNLYQYGFELLIGQAVNLLIACLLAIIFQAYVTVFLFLVTFIPLRSFAGGHNADSHEVCTIVSNLIICAVCILAGRIPDGAILGVNLASGALCGIFIFLFAPVEDHNKPLDEKERTRYGRYSKVIWGIETLIWIGCYTFRMRNISLVIGLAHMAVMILLCGGLIKRRSERRLL